MKCIIHRGITSNRNKDNSYIAIKRAILDKESIGVEFEGKKGIIYLDSGDYIEIKEG